jgi:hypothetical protein
LLRFFENSSAFLLVFDVRLLWKLKNDIFFLNKDNVYFIKMLYLCTIFWD